MGTVSFSRVPDLFGNTSEHFDDPSVKQDSKRVPKRVPARHKRAANLARGEKWAETVERFREVSHPLWNQVPHIVCRDWGWRCRRCGRTALRVEGSFPWFFFEDHRGANCEQRPGWQRPAVEES